MTITVVTPDHGDQSFDATDWEIQDIDAPHGGSLWIGNGNTAVAEFAKGSWLFVYEPKEIPINPGKPEPRKWDSLYRTPYSARVLDTDGDLYVYRDGHWRWGTHLTPLTADEVRFSFNQYAPFTEVIA